MASRASTLAAAFEKYFPPTTDHGRQIAGSSSSSTAGDRTSKSAQVHNIDNVASSDGASAAKKVLASTMDNGRQIAGSSSSSDVANGAVAPKGTRTFEGSSMDSGPSAAMPVLTLGNMPISKGTAEEKIEKIVMSKKMEEKEYADEEIEVGAHETVSSEQADAIKKRPKKIARRFWDIRRVNVPVRAVNHIPTVVVVTPEDELDNFSEEDAQKIRGFRNEHVYVGVQRHV